MSTMDYTTKHGKDYGPSRHRHRPMTPRGRAEAAIGGRPKGFDDAAATYDAQAGVPRNMTRGDAKPDLNPSPFTGSTKPANPERSPFAAKDA